VGQETGASGANAPEHQEDGWVPVAIESYQYQMVPWVGRRYEKWLRSQVRTVPHDPGIVLVPGRIYEVFRRRPLMSPITEEEARRIGIGRG